MFRARFRRKRPKSRQYCRIFAVSLTDISLFLCHIYIKRGIAFASAGQRGNHVRIREIRKRKFSGIISQIRTKKGGIIAPDEISEFSCMHNQAQTATIAVCSYLPHATVFQRIGYGPPKPAIQVRFLSVAPITQFISSLPCHARRRIGSWIFLYSH